MTKRIVLEAAYDTITAEFKEDKARFVVWDNEDYNEGLKGLAAFLEHIGDFVVEIKEIC